MKIRLSHLTISFCVLAATSTPVSAGVGAAQSTPDTQEKHDEVRPAQAPTLIRTKVQLDAYLKAKATSATPLDLLSPGARERFLASLAFGRTGLGGFDTQDLAHELTPDQIRQVLALFGPDVEAYAAKIRVKDGTGGDSAPVPRNTKISDLERRYNLFYRADYEAHGKDEATYASILGERAEALLPEMDDPSALGRLGDHDLWLLSQAAQSAAQSPEPRRVQAYKHVFTERERRGQVSLDDIKALQNLLVSGRRFEEARQLASSHRDAGLPPLPAFSDPLPPSNDRATIWRIDADGAAFTRAAVDLTATQIIVTASCHLSQDAAEDISVDPLLGPVFARHAQWLTLPPGREQIGLARDWNRRFPKAQVAMAYDLREWDMLPDWNTPVFYIVRDGKVIEQAVGWRRGVDAGSRQPLIDALRRAGLLPAQQ